MVYLVTKNIITKRFSKKLDYKYIELYKVTKKILKNNYQLNLPLKIKIYLIFYIFLFENAKNVKLQNTKRNNVKVKKEKYKAKKIFDIRNYERKIEYLVKWKKYENIENI